MRSFDPQLILREELGELKAYSPSPGSYETRLDANEAPDLLSNELKKRLAEIATKTAWEKYPDAGQKALRKAIAQHHGLTPQQIIAGVGSDELITILLTAATRLRSKAPAPTLVTTTPTFVMYRMSARIRGQRVMEVPLDQDWNISEEALLRAIDMADPNLVFLASPNNPTGTMLSAECLENVAKGAPNSLIVVDEAYIDYADRDQTDLLSKYENVAILRTLSKVGFASLRVGWMVASPALVTEIDKVRLPYNLPTICQNMAVAVLNEFGGEISNICSTVKAERSRVFAELHAMKHVNVVPSQANFLWMEFEHSASDVFKSLGQKGVLVRSFQGRGGRLEKCLRVTIGRKEQNDRFLEAMSESL
jgi:histidinol-phosphate aminotransferase